ncbi:MAG: hypothetical protein M3024_13325 [Candidatus Dormibacteraeota bacterium]|nr:hypothetical protein [Candidatus Dormibacteraeota bacterium]
MSVKHPDDDRRSDVVTVKWIADATRSYISLLHTSEWVLDRVPGGEAGTLARLTLERLGALLAVLEPKP